MTLQSAFTYSKQSTEIILGSDAPSISSKEIVSTETIIVLFEIAEAFYSSCPYEKAFHGYLLSFTESSMHNFIGKSIISLQRSQAIGDVALKSSQLILNFSRSSMALLPKFITTWIQVLYKMKQLCRNFYFRLLCYGIIYTLEENACDIKIEKFGFNWCEKPAKNWAVLTHLEWGTSQNGGAQNLKTFSLQTWFQKEEEEVTLL